MSEEMKEVGALEPALAPIDRSQFMPAMSIELAVERYNAVTEFVSRVLRKDVDYGIIPGTEKRTLLKPGAEKLTTFFGLSTRFHLIERIEDWTGAAYDAEPFFYYLYRCQLLRGDLLFAEADGSCNSREQKYRWRDAQRTCPACGQAAIIKGREEYGGGWLCFSKKGGCGAKFANGDAAIENQQTGRVPNPNIADQVNTIQKMAQKRALVAATLLAVNASEFFTQDVEDMVIETTAVVKSEGEETPRPVRERFDTKPVISQTEREASVPAEKYLSLEDNIRAACRALGKTEEQLADWVRKKYGAPGIDDLTLADKRQVLAFLQSRIANQRAA